MKTTAKKIVVSTLFAFAISLSSNAQTVIGSIYQFTGSSTADNQFNNVTAPTTGLTFSPFTRTNVNWNTGADAFNSRDWNTTEALLTDEYVSFQVTANSGYSANLTDISFVSRRSGTGPDNVRVAYSLNNFLTTTGFLDYTLSGTSNVTTPFDFTNFDLTSGQTASFRFYAWSAGGDAGTLRFDDVALNGTVVPELSNVLIGGLLGLGMLRRRRQA